MLWNVQSKLLCLAGDWAPQTRRVAPVDKFCSFILNIEAPIIDTNSSYYSPSAKAGPVLFNLQLPVFPERSIAVLANNHMMDYGTKGLFATMSALEDSGWGFTGAGVNYAKSHAPLFFSWRGSRCALISCCETQFGVSSHSKAGVAAFDVAVYETIRRLKGEADFVIVSIHAGAEMVPWPSPARQVLFRSIIDAGADVVHGHHSHIPQGWEEYRKGYIFYGLGNFCVDPNSWGWHPHGLWSLVPELELTTQGLKVSITTYVIEEKDEFVCVRRAGVDESQSHLEYLNVCNLPLSDIPLLEGLWQEVSVVLYKRYFADWLGFNDRSFLNLSKDFVRRKLVDVKFCLSNDRCRQSELLLRNQQLLRYHLWACESHRDTITTALGVLSGELEDLRSKTTSRLVNEMFFVS